MTRKTAIVLRGPPAVGKTTTKDCLLRKLGIGDEAFLNLDCDDPSLIAARKDIPVLVLELGYGEGSCPPQEGTALGPTRNPKPWIQALRSQNRDLYSFLLIVDWAEAELRIRKKWREAPENIKQRWPESDYVANQKPYHDFYRTEACRAFPQEAGLQEQMLDFHASPEALAEQIIRACGLIGSPKPPPTEVP